MPASPPPVGAVDEVDVDGSTVRLVPVRVAPGLDLSKVADSSVRSVIAAARPDEDQLICALDERGRTIGAARLTVGGSSARAAVAVDRRWRRRGLGTELAGRVVRLAQDERARQLTCRWPGHTDAARASRLFGRRCVSRVRVGLEELLVLALTDSGPGVSG
jgi:GNAT superfamily N-acetyltransferase